LAAPNVQKSMDGIGCEPISISSAEHAALIQREIP
jgi:hypothetical protein